LQVDYISFVDKLLIFHYNIQMNQLPCIDLIFMNLPRCILIREAKDITFDILML